MIKPFSTSLKVNILVLLNSLVSTLDKNVSEILFKLFLEASKLDTIILIITYNYSFNFHNLN